MLVTGMVTSGAQM